MSIFLCGFMGCGKTTVGKELSKLAGLSYIDTDEYIVAKQGLSIPEIFEKYGEPYFREVEAKAIKELAPRKAVIACGGGAMINDESSKIARQNGTVVFLDVPFEECFERIKNDENRPIAIQSTREQLEQRYKDRYPIYIKNSSCKVSALDSPTLLARKILDEIKILEG